MASSQRIYFLLCFLSMISSTLALSNKPVNEEEDYGYGTDKWSPAEKEWLRNYMKTNYKNRSVREVIEGETTLTVKKNDVKFYLHTRGIYEIFFYELFTGDVTNLLNSPFNASNPTKFIIHGFQSSIVNDVFQLPKKEYLKKGAYNVIGVDWSNVAKSIFYPIVVSQLPEVGKLVSKFIDFLVLKGNVKLPDVHVIGHSLGAQISGYVSNFLQVGHLWRVTGMDPAGPGFLTAGADYKLDPSDAGFVDIIHTNPGVYGIYYSVGDIDFYPNGGTPQPGCETDLSGVCSHSRAYEYFAESITSEIGFVSRRCKNWISFVYNTCFDVKTLMGEFVNPSARGDFYLQTRDHSPYALGYQ